MIETFKKLSYERKLGMYFSLLTSLVDKLQQLVPKTEHKTEKKKTATTIMKKERLIRC